MCSTSVRLASRGMSPEKRFAGACEQGKCGHDKAGDQRVMAPGPPRAVAGNERCGIRRCGGRPECNWKMGQRRMQRMLSQLQANQNRPRTPTSRIRKAVTASRCVTCDKACRQRTLTGVITQREREAAKRRNQEQVQRPSCRIARALLEHCKQQQHQAGRCKGAVYHGNPNRRCASLEVANGHGQSRNRRSGEYQQCPGHHLGLPLYTSKVLHNSYTPPVGYAQDAALRASGRRPTGEIGRKAANPLSVRRFIDV